MSSQAITPLSATDDDEVFEYLEENAMPIHWCQGFFVGLASVPIIVPASEWLEIIFNGSPEFSSPDLAQRVIGLLMRTYDSCLVVGDSDITLIAPNADDIDGSELWCSGFLAAVDMADDADDADVDVDHADIAVHLRMMSALARELSDDELAEMAGQWDKVAAENGRTVDDGSRDRVEVMLGDWRRHVPRLAMSCFEFWRKDRIHMKQPRARPAASKPGRNDPCPCGSGRKFKRCCMQ